MGYKEFSTIYTYGLFLGSAVGAIIVAFLSFSGIVKSLSLPLGLLLYLAIVISFIIGAWYFKIKKKKDQ